MNINLTLNLKGEYFDDIKSNNKTEEYRLYNDYWRKRIENKNFDLLIIKKGYPANLESAKILRMKYCGYEIKTISHKHFGSMPVKVFAIKCDFLAQKSF